MFQDLVQGLMHVMWGEIIEIKDWSFRGEIKVAYVRGSKTLMKVLDAMLNDKS